MPFTQYYGQFQGFRGNLGGVPPWARGILMLAAIPGLLVVLAGVVLLVAGVALVLVFVVPIYRFVRFIIGGKAVSEPSVPTVQDPDGPGRKAVESRVV